MPSLIGLYHFVQTYKHMTRVHIHIGTKVKINIEFNLKNNIDYIENSELKYCKKVI